MITNGTVPRFERHEFVSFQPEVAIPVILILVIASVAGTLGNILILVSIATRKSLQNVESIFIVNLAIADLYVTAVADWMSIVAKIEGPAFFERAPGLCRAVGSVCTISCVASLLNICSLTCNRYIYIVHNSLYTRIFNKRNSITMCVCFYAVGTLLVLLNIANVGDHSYDHRSLECIWDRMANVSYTITFAVVMIWTPLIIVGLTYLHMYLYVRKNRGRIHNARGGSKKQPNHKLAKTLFLIYCVFSMCWIPYAMLLVIGHHARHEVFVFLVTLAHLHPSINWLVYFLTNRKFHDAFVDILHLSRCVKVESDKPSNYTTNVRNDRPLDKTAVSVVSSTGPH